MTPEEIFQKLSGRRIQGVMIHQQYADYYNFLGLHGYERCHQYQAYEELIGLTKLHDSFITVYDKLVPQAEFTNPEIVPQTWRRYSRNDIDGKTKRQAVRDGFDRWCAWETETLSIAENACKQLAEIGEAKGVEIAFMIVRDVTDELERIKRQKMALSSVDYDMIFILDEQDKEYHKYQKMMKGLRG